jgi:hypothetical protein
MAENFSDSVHVPADGSDARGDLVRASTMRSSRIQLLGGPLERSSSANLHVSNTMRAGRGSPC